MLIFKLVFFMKMDSNEKKLSVINKLCGKNRHLQALRKSGVLYRRAAKLLKQYKESVEDIVNVVSPSELQGKYSNVTAIKFTVL